MLFCLRKIEVYFQNFFYARSNRLFRQSHSSAYCTAVFMCKSKRPRITRGPLPVQNMNLRRNAGYAVISFFCVPQRPDHRRKGRLPPRTTQRQTRRPLPGSSCCCRRSQRCCRTAKPYRQPWRLCPYRCRP